MYVQICGILCECLFCDFCFMILNAIFTEPTSFCNQFSLTTLFHLLHKLHHSQHEVSRRDRIWNQTRYWYICKIKTFCPGSSPCSLVVRFMFQAIDPSSTFSAVVRQIITSSFLNKCRQPWYGPIPRQQTHGHTLVWAGAHFSRTTMGLKICTSIFHVCWMKLVTLLIMICACHPCAECCQKWFALVLGNVQHWAHFAVIHFWNFCARSAKFCWTLTTQKSIEFSRSSLLKCVQRRP